MTEKDIKLVLVHVHGLLETLLPGPGSANASLLVKICDIIATTSNELDKPKVKEPPKT
jgi:hypothetical protein